MLLRATRGFRPGRVFCPRPIGLRPIGTRPPPPPPPPSLLLRCYRLLALVPVVPHALSPDEDGDTYEHGLYLASRRELDQQQYRHMDDTSLRGWFYRAGYLLRDYVYEPLRTLFRALELGCIFLPVLLVYPITFFGQHDKAGTRSGALAWYRLLRLAAETAGASFVKLGQWAASRTDLFLSAFCKELGRLHLNNRAHLLLATMRIVEKAFDGMPFHEIFEEFPSEPIGVGAIGQVYIARLKPDLAERMAEHTPLEGVESVLDRNRRFLQKLMTSSIGHGRGPVLDPSSASNAVAIKVLHPGVEKTIERDLRIMLLVAQTINAIPTMEWLLLPDEVAQFGLLMRMQLDLRIEGLNLQRFRHNFASHDDILFPAPYLEYALRHVLVEEYVSGVLMEKLLTLRSTFGHGLAKEVSDKGLDAFLKMLILDNFVHADLHPGNIMVRFYRNELFQHTKEHKIVNTLLEAEMNEVVHRLKQLGNDTEAWARALEQLYAKGYHAELVFIDAGLVTELNDTNRTNFIALFRALSEFDGYAAGELMAERSRTPETVVDKEVFALKVERLVDKVKKRTFALGSVSIGDLLDQVLLLVRTHHVRMEGDFVLVVVAILLLEGLGRQLDPELDLFARFVYACVVGFPTEAVAWY